MSEVEVPEVAVRAAYASPYDGLTNKSIRSVLELGSPLVLAAEFRRQAEAMRRESNKCSQLDARGLLLAARMLDDRADELESQGGTR
jgi:hypothetical protein